MATDNNMNADSESLVIKVVSELPPVPVFTAAPISGPAPLTVNLDASASYDPDSRATGSANSGIINYDWSSSDGSPIASGIRSRIVYCQPGAYTVTLKVIDDEARLAPIQKTITVTPAQLPLLGRAWRAPQFDVMPSAEFRGGVQLMSSGGFLAEGGSFLDSEEVNIYGEAVVTPAHRGQSAETFVILEVQNPVGQNSQFLMKTDSPLAPFVPWQYGSMGTIRASGQVAALPEVLSIPVFEGRLSGAVGFYQIYIGYRLLDGTLIFNYDKRISFEVKK
jgi:PKD repeat protein